MDHPRIHTYFQSGNYNDEVIKDMPKFRYNLVRTKMIDRYDGADVTNSFWYYHHMNQLYDDDTIYRKGIINYVSKEGIIDNTGRLSDKYEIKEETKPATPFKKKDGDHPSEKINKNDTSHGEDLQSNMTTIQRVNSKRPFGIINFVSKDGVIYECPGNRKESNNHQKRKRRLRSNLMKPGSQLYQFILQLLDDESKKDHITWVDRSIRVFRILKKDQVAQLWGKSKNRTMSYASLSRGLRHYYDQGLLRPVNKKLHYQFTIKAVEQWDTIRNSKPTDESMTSS